MTCLHAILPSFIPRLVADEETLPSVCTSNDRMLSLLLLLLVLASPEVATVRMGVTWSNSHARKIEKKLVCVVLSSNATSMLVLVAESC